MLNLESRQLAVVVLVALLVETSGAWSSGASPASVDAAQFRTNHAGGVTYLGSPGIERQLVRAPGAVITGTVTQVVTPVSPRREARTTGRMTIARASRHHSLLTVTVDSVYAGNAPSEILVRRESVVFNSGDRLAYTEIGIGPFADRPIPVGARVIAHARPIDLEPSGQPIAPDDVKHWFFVDELWITLTEDVLRSDDRVYSGWRVLPEYTESAFSSTKLVRGGAGLIESDSVSEDLGSVLERLIVRSEIAHLLWDEKTEWEEGP